jgi:hypothetical protein
MSPVVRNLANRLVNNGSLAMPFYKKGLSQGPSVEHMAKSWQGEVLQLHHDTSILWARYNGVAEQDVWEVGGLKKTQMPAVLGGIKKNAALMSYEEFVRQTTQRVIDGQLNPVPEINELAGKVVAMNERVRVAAAKYGAITDVPAMKVEIDLLTNRIDRLKRYLGTAQNPSQASGIAADIVNLERRVDMLKTNITKSEANGPREDYFTRVFSRMAIEKNRDHFRDSIVIPWMEKQNRVEVWTDGKQEIQDMIDMLVFNNGSQRQIDILQARHDAAPTFSMWVWRDLSMNPDAILARAEEMIDDLLKEGDPIDASTMPKGNRPVFGRHRAFNIPNRYLLKDGPEGNGISDYIETDFILVSRIYMDRMGPAIEMGRAFGDISQGLSGEQGFSNLMKAGEKDEAERWLKMAVAPDNIDEAADLYNSIKGRQPRRTATRLTSSEMSAARDRLAELGLHGVKVENLPVAARATVYGRWNALANTIYLNPENPNFMRTLDHEAIHAMRHHGIIKDSDWKSLVDMAKTTAIKADIERRYANVTPDIQEEEMVAELAKFWTAMGGGDRAIKALQKVGISGARATKLGNMLERIVSVVGAILGRNKEQMASDILANHGFAARDMKRRGQTFAQHWSGIKRDMEVLKDRVSNRAIKDPSRWDNRAATALRSYSQLVTMGMSGLSALQEIAVMNATWGHQKMFGEITQRFMQSKNSVATREHRAVLQEEFRKNGISLDVLQASALSTFMETGMDAVHGTRAERLLKTTANKYFLFNGMSSITNLYKSIDYNIRVPHTVAMIFRVADGTANEADLTQLARFGISKSMALRMRNEPMDLQDDLYSANTADWADRDLARIFQASMLQANESTILLASAADKPSVMDGIIYIRKRPFLEAHAERMNLDDYGTHWRVQSGLATLPFQFWNYMLAASNKLLLSRLTEPERFTMGGFAGIIGLGYFMTYLRSDPDAWERKSFADKVMTAVDRSGVAGSYFTQFNMLQAASMGVTGYGVVPFLGKTSGTPGGGIAATAMDLTGPGPNVMENLVVGAATGDMETMSWGIFFRNFLPIKSMIDKMVEN